MLAYDCKCAQTQVVYADLHFARRRAGRKKRATVFIHVGAIRPPGAGGRARGHLRSRGGRGRAPSIAVDVCRDAHIRRGRSRRLSPLQVGSRNFFEVSCTTCTYAARVHEARCARFAHELQTKASATAKEGSLRLRLLPRSGASAWAGAPRCKAGTAQRNAGRRERARAYI